MAQTINLKAVSAFSLDRIPVADALAKELAVVLNKAHKTGFSERFWKIVLQHYINVAVTRKPFLENKEVNIRPEVEAINGFGFPSLTQKIKSRAIYNLRAFKSIGKRSEIEKILCRENDVAFGFDDTPLIRKEVGVPISSHYPFLVGYRASDARTLLHQYADTYDDKFYRNAIKSVPQVYIEFFKLLFDSIKLFNPGLKSFHVLNLHSVFDSILIAKYVENGAKLFYYQHGGYYGELIGHNAHYHESSVADQFRTWGWKLTDKDVPWKAYRLEKFKNQYRSQADETKYDCLLCYSVIAKHNRPRIEADTKYFLDNINPGTFKRILARPRPVSKIFSVKKQLNFIRDKRVTIDSGLGKMSDAVSSAHLVIQFTYPSTNFMECLYVDHPTVAILKNDQPTAIVKPYYDFFLQAGVLHRDFASLVHHLNTVNIDQWWKRIISNPTYAAFKNEFLRKV